MFGTFTRISELKENVTEQELLKLIIACNQNNGIDGILVQSPLPPHINEEVIIEAINPKKDVGHTHPWHWSFNSLSNIFKFCGFELVKANRYFDENDLVLIFKRSENFNQKFKFDNYQNVISFFKRWSEESNNYKKINS